MSLSNTAITFGPSVEELLERNKQYAAGHKPIPSLLARTKNDPKMNGPHVLIVSCLDSRANPLTFLGLNLRECLILRNVAGRFSSAASDIAALDTFFHISQIILVHHSNCGASHITKQQVLDGICQKRPEFVTTTAGGFGELEARLPMKEDNRDSLVEDLKRAKTCGFLRKDLVDGIVGLWLDVETGLVTKVFPDDDGN
ncbi:uncharacterized protein Z519_02550 [Cladophialophora bantiana CBS 173.52]|uniref:Carbonic anhydrase n=1 Tax=Cladophialophora bantiana (strain ATCC 10958 / CBS 173.52 / CDC B-1940 / NIH 8579) TaxID=1442370 RepID=A0A0D2HUW1_CLAB1|nr:uncharacterized protein Z519_02550 [Cladophialophora bantiana CBS 173.52]KIW97158.1 hypothetical protein Z519_02550 [Cladophialophora bantiana CBS 173.52]